MRSLPRGVAILSPLLLFPALWLLGVALAQLQLFDLQRPWSTLMWIVVAVVPVAFVAGGLLGGAVVAARVRWVRTAPELVAGAGRRRLRWSLVACVAIGYGELAHQFAAGGVVPLFSSNIDAARAALPGGPTIVLTDLLTVAAIAALTVPARLFSRSAVFELGIAAVVLLGYALAGGRLLLIIPLVSAVIARALHGRLPRPRALLITAVAALAIVSGLFYLRASQHADNPFERELYERVLPATPPPLQPLVPLHAGLALNFEALARVVEFFPEQASYGYGRYNALGLDLFIPQARNLGTITAELSGPWVTSTAAGPLWADGGLPVVALGMAVIGAISTAAYTFATRTRELRHAMPAGYLVFLALFGFYQNMWTQHVDWLLITPLLFVLGLLARTRSSERTPSGPGGGRE